MRRRERAERVRGGCGELPGAEGDSCGACDAGQWACDGTELICVGDSVESNACGGCGPIVGTPGDPCDDGCGAGTLTCSADGEALFCVGPTTGNPCGGCGELTGGGQPGAACSTCGVWECVDPFTTECTNPRGTNACGGCELLEGWPGDGCGCGGRGTWACNGADEVICVGGDETNACGGCTDITISFPPIGVPCGACGEWACDGPDSVVCADEGANDCGSCREVPDGFALGESCGCGGTWTCEDGGQCDFDGVFSNACGGCGDLDGFPGASCGACGTWSCDGAEAVVCDDPGVNVCGGCGTIDVAASPGDACGECSVWVCSSDNAALSCVADGANACGTCAVLEAEPGFPCGVCGTWDCDATGDAVECVDAGANACGGCGTLAGDPGTPCDFGCGVGQWTCDPETGDAVCDAPPRNRCGGCVELPEGQEPFAPCDGCGNFVCNGLDETICAPGVVNDCGAASAARSRPATRAPSAASMAWWSVMGPLRPRVRRPQRPTRAAVVRLWILRRASLVARAARRCVRAPTVLFVSTRVRDASVPLESLMSERIPLRSMRDAALAALALALCACAEAGTAGVETPGSSEDQAAPAAAALGGTGAGLEARYFDNVDHTNLVGTRTDARLDLRFDGDTLALDASRTVQAESFSAEWTGLLEAPTTDTYALHATGHDYVELCSRRDGRPQSSPRHARTTAAALGSAL